MPKKQNRIAKITVRGFKSIRTEQYIDIRPLTLLAGANSAGKSSFIQPLLLLKQTLDAPGDPGTLLMDGANVRFTKAEQLLAKSCGKASISDFSIKIHLFNGQTLESVFQKEEKRGFEIARMRFEGDNQVIEVLPEMSHEDIVKILPSHIRKFHESIEKQEKENFQWAVVRERCFLSFELVSKKEALKRVIFGPYSVSPSNQFVPFIQGIMHLPGLRGNPRRDYPKASVGPDFQGTFEPYVASVISRWQEESPEMLVQLGVALEEMGLTWKVEAKPVDDTRVELKVGRLLHARKGGARDLVSIADVGFGVSQSLPVVVALLAAHPGQLVYLEQPEIHLHPLAQRRLANVLRAAVQRGVVVVVETHSALLLREIQTLIAKGNLKRHEVAFHWLQRGEDGGTVVRTADLDNQGAYGDWPEDFDITELDAEKSYLDAVEGKGPAQ